MPTSKTKGQVIASNFTMANGISLRLHALGVSATRTMKVFGIDIAAGRGNLHGGLKVRFSAIIKKGMAVAKT